DDCLDAVPTPAGSVPGARPARAAESRGLSPLRTRVPVADVADLRLGIRNRARAVAPSLVTSRFSGSGLAHSITTTRPKIGEACCGGVDRNESRSRGDAGSRLARRRGRSSRARGARPGDCEVVLLLGTGSPTPNPVERARASRGESPKARRRSRPPEGREADSRLVRGRARSER